MSVYKEYEQTAKDHKLGIWKATLPEGFKQEQIEDLESFVKNNKDKEIQVMVEQVISASLLILSFNNESIRAEMNEVMFPKLDSVPFA